MGDNVWIRTEGGNWYPGKVSSNNVKRGQTRQVLDLAIDSISTKYRCFIERGAILSGNIPHWLTHKKKFRTIERGDKARYAKNTYITPSGWVVVAVLLLPLREYSSFAPLTRSRARSRAQSAPPPQPTLALSNYLRLHHHDEDIPYGGICREDAIPRSGLPVGIRGLQREMH